MPMWVIVAGVVAVLLLAFWTPIRQKYYVARVRRQNAKTVAEARAAGKDVVFLDVGGGVKVPVVAPEIMPVK